jgi:hypothetical protein
VAASVETHLLTCEHCRHELRTTVASVATTGDREVAPSTDRIWHAIADRIDQPTRAWHDQPWLRTTIGTPALLFATAVLLLALVTVPVAAAMGNTRVATAVLIALAPLAPLLGAVLAFRIGTDPAGELAAATPLVSMRLVLVRAGVVLAVALPVGIAMSALMPVPFTLVIGWLLPGLGLCTIVLMSARAVEPTHLAAALGAAWAVAVGAAFARTRHEPLEVALRQLFVNQTFTQVMFGVITAVGAAVLFAHRADPRPWSTR